MRHLIGGALIIIVVALALGGVGDALAVESNSSGMPQGTGLAANNTWAGPSDDLTTARVLLRESGSANLTLLAGDAGCAVPPDDALVDSNPDMPFTAVFAACCKICDVGKACGDSCIARNLTCHKGIGCACDLGAQPTITLAPATPAPTRAVTPPPTPVPTPTRIATSTAPPVVATATRTAAATAAAATERPSPSAPVPPNQGGPGMGTGLFIGGIAAAGGWIIYRRRRQDL
ncbi:MAG TPA: hypothetical protein VLI88_00555 [Patescibacteria group bacterium]|jgi:hypothetical protein|nr:hypothetical protein [Patescibacteria group bacterium]